MAVPDWIGARPIRAASDGLHGLVGWGALSRGTAPDVEPWEHASLDL